jgi:hypothetical protein
MARIVVCELHDSTERDASVMCACGAKQQSEKCDAPWQAARIAQQELRTQRLFQRFSSYFQHSFTNRSPHVTRNKVIRDATKFGKEAVQRSARDLRQQCTLIQPKQIWHKAASSYERQVLGHWFAVGVVAARELGQPHLFAISATRNVCRRVNIRVNRWQTNAPDIRRNAPQTHLKIDSADDLTDKECLPIVAE